MYTHGQGVPQNDGEAVSWFRKAADQGNVYAQTYLAIMYREGRGVRQDYVEAEKWYRMAADRGFALAQYDFGKAYEQGRGVPQDYAEAARWFRKAAEQGSTDAQTSLGLLYHDGKGVPQDYAEAVTWYRKAAEQGNGVAQHNLGDMYDNGRGVAQDLAEAERWYRKAADQGIVEAQQALKFVAARRAGKVPNTTPINIQAQFVVNTTPDGVCRDQAQEIVSNPATRWPSPDPKERADFVRSQIAPCLAANVRPCTVKEIRAKLDGQEPNLKCTNLTPFEARHITTFNDGVAYNTEGCRRQSHPGWPRPRVCDFVTKLNAIDKDRVAQAMYKLDEKAKQCLSLAAQEGTFDAPDRCGLRHDRNTSDYLRWLTFS